MSRRLLLLLALLGTLLAVAPSARAAAPLEVGIQDDHVFVDNRFGYNLDSAYRSSRAMGARWMRIMVAWNQTLTPAQARAKKAPKTKRYTWGQYDSAIKRAQAQGFKVQLALKGPAPAWATSNKRIGFTRPKASEYGKWVGAAVRRYRSRGVTRYAMWNEPNHVGSLAPLGSSPTLYRALYQSGYAAARKASPNATILIGETAPYAKRGQSLAPLAFLRSMLCVSSSYKSRSRRCPKFRADGFAHHPYDNFTPPSKPRKGKDNVTIGSISRLTTALDRFARLGALRKRTSGKLSVYLTEFGYFARATNKNTAAVPESKRPGYSVGAFNIALRHPRVKQLVWYQLLEPRGKESWLSYVITKTGAGTRTFVELVNWAKRTQAKLAK
jgi:Cellulase (glycosyl hydrolase family 5)